MRMIFDNRQSTGQLIVSNQTLCDPLEHIWSYVGSPELRKAAVDIIERLKYSAGYDPEAIPNPCEFCGNLVQWE
jgi:hypothetical protein